MDYNTNYFFMNFEVKIKIIKITPNRITAGESWSFVASVSACVMPAANMMKSREMVERRGIGKGKMQSPFKELHNGEVKL